jgi:hypothetical protein
MTDLINELISVKAVYRTAPATPGLLTMKLWTRKLDTILTSPCVSCVKCHMSGVTCHVKKLQMVFGGSVINWAYSL